jgi:hypothetical protein
MPCIFTAGRRPEKEMKGRKLTGTHLTGEANVSAAILVGGFRRAECAGGRPGVF